MFTFRAKKKKNSDDDESFFDESVFVNKNEGSSKPRAAR